MYKAVWVAIGIVAAVLLPFFLILLVVSTKDSYAAWQKISRYVNKNEKSILQIYTEVYPNSLACDKLENKQACQSSVAQSVSSKLPNFEKVEFNQGVYFVSLEGSEIHKLFQDGTHVRIPASIQKRMALWVFAHLGLSPLSTFRIGSEPVFRFFGDFHSEAELLVPLSSGFSEVRMVVVPYGD